MISYVFTLDEPSGFENIFWDLDAVFYTFYSFLNSLFMDGHCTCRVIFWNLTSPGCH